jgi:adenylosuccinate lyase
LKANSGGSLGLVPKGITALIERYTRPEMGAVWSDDQKIERWLLIEQSVCEAWHRRGRIPDWAIHSIRSATCDLERMREIEKETDHDLIAFLRAVSEGIGEASRFVHLGMTSSDVVDTGLSLQVKDAGALINTVGRQALRYRGTVIVGRTHGVHAEPTTFGLKLAVWYDELRRHRARLEHSLEDMRVGKVSGAVGTHAHVPPELEEEVCEELGLRAATASTQVLQRDRHAFFLSVLAGLGATIEKISVEIRHLQRTEVREVEEPFGEGNLGSSAMPHKRNPHESERLTGIARLLRGYAVAALENVALWHERDISHSSAERVIFPDACILLDYSLALLAEIIENWRVSPERMEQNLHLTGGLIFSQPLLLALIDSGMDRQEAYGLVQRLATRAWDTGESFESLASSDEDIHRALSKGQVTEIFDVDRQLIHVDSVFERLGLLKPSALCSMASASESFLEER